MNRLRRIRDAIRRAFREFLAVPTAVITAFLLLAAAVEAVDRSTPGWLEPMRDFLKHHLFIDAGTTSDVLAAVAAGIITVTSITVSVLLLAVQQSAASMSTAVFDQFLRRRENQLSFGYFIGLGLYTLVTLATVHDGANAVLGATLCVICTVAALYALLVLLHSTVDQMRPSVVLRAITRLTLQARRSELELVRRTRRTATPGLPVRTRITAGTTGYVTRIDLAAMARALEREAGVEVVLLVSVGSFVAFGDVAAEIRGGGVPDVGRSAPADVPGDEREGSSSLAVVIRRAIHLETDRDIGGDPAYGIQQIATIGWTSISSAKSSPSPGTIAIRSLRDLLARWAPGRPEEFPPGSPRSADGGASPGAEDAPLPVVYPDGTVRRVFDALESFGVAASESKQHQSLAEVVHALASLVDRLTSAERREAAGVIERLLPSLDAHVYTRVLDEALALAATRFEAAGEAGTAGAIRDARQRAGA